MHDVCFTGRTRLLDIRTRTRMSMVRTIHFIMMLISLTFNLSLYHTLPFHESRTEATCAEAAKNDMISCLTYAHENGCPWNEAMCRMAAENNMLQYLKYAHENGCAWDRRTCEGAAKHGTIDALIYVHENGCPWSELTCSGAMSIASSMHTSTAASGIRSSAQSPLCLGTWTVSSTRMNRVVLGTCYIHRTILSDYVVLISRLLVLYHVMFHRATGTSL